MVTPGFPEGIPTSVPLEPELESEILGLCLKRADAPTDLDQSERYLYFDVDYLTGLNLQVGLQARAMALRRFYESLNKAVEAVASVYPIDALAYPVRAHRSGPMGLSPAAFNFFHQAMSRPAYHTNPRLLTLSSQVRPECTLPTDAKFAIITDITATGMEVVKNATILWKRGYKGVCAISVFDTDEGARENLAHYDIPLTTIMSAGSLAMQASR